jgi:hypothetical protein
VWAGSTQGESISFLRECGAIQGERFFFGSLGGSDEGDGRKGVEKYGGQGVEERRAEV